MPKGSENFRQKNLAALNDLQTKIDETIVRLRRSGKYPDTLSDLVWSGTWLESARRSFRRAPREVAGEEE
jgi:hypothetical protein